MKLGNIGMAVNHNSPYLLKKADGSFIDPETGERLGFDHRFMATGEGYQAHGWGSYFSENDRRHYADNQRQLNKYKGTTDIYKLHLKNADEWAVMHTLSDLELYPTLTVDEIIQKAINDYEAKITIDEEKLVLLNKIKNIGDDSVEYWKDKFEKFVLEDKIKTIVGDGNAAQWLCVDMGTCLTLDQYPYSKIISAYEKSLHNSCVDAEEMIAAYKRLNPADFERVVKERHHYEVEIPDNDGLIYIEEKKTLTDEQIQMVLDGLGRWQVIDVRTDKWLKPYTNSDGKPFSYEGGGNWIGITLYNWLCEAFDYEHKYRDMKPADAGRRASQFLHDCGFVGIHYSSYTDGKCYVIFDENDAKIVSHELFGLGMAVNHNSPYLLKKADGSFIDPETGERLGFDHRFMGKGEGNQIHGWGSYFSENDLSLYAEFGGNPNTYRGMTQEELNSGVDAPYPTLRAIDDVLDVMNIHQSRTPAGIIEEYIDNYQKYIKSNELKLKELDKAAAIGDDSVNYKQNRAACKKLCDKLSVALDSIEGRIVYTWIVSDLNYEYEPYSKIIKKRRDTCEWDIREEKAMLAAYSKLTPDDFERHNKERHHYIVDIPDHNGWNYIEEADYLTQEQIQKILDGWKYIAEYARAGMTLEPPINAKGQPFAYDFGRIWEGEMVYRWLRDRFEGDNDTERAMRASKFLHRCGFVGIHYTGYRDGSCYVIFDEADAKIVNHKLFGLSGNDEPRFKVGDWIEYFPLAEEAKRGKYKGKLWVHNITAVGDTYTVDSWCVQTRQPSRNRQLTIDGQQEWYRKIERPRWATATDGKAKRLRLAKAKAKAAIAILELMKI